MSSMLMLPLCWMFFSCGAGREQGSKEQAGRGQEHGEQGDPSAAGLGSKKLGVGACSGAALEQSGRAFAAEPP